MSFYTEIQNEMKPEIKYLSQFVNLEVIPKSINNDEFIHGLESDDKSLHGCWEYLMWNAKKITGHSIGLPDEVVLPWVLEYYSQEKTKMELEKEEKIKEKEERNKKYEEAKQKRIDIQMAKSQEQTEEEKIKEKIKNKEQITLEEIQKLNDLKKKSKVKQDDKGDVLDGQISLF